MTEARIVATVPSIDEAKVFLAQARRFASDARAAGLSDVGRQLLLYQACIAACDAALNAEGLQVEGSEGGHRLRIDHTANLLDLDADLIDALRDARDIRAGSAYRAGFVSDDEVAGTEEAAGQLIVEVEAFVAEREDG